MPRTSGVNAGESLGPRQAKLAGQKLGGASGTRRSDTLTQKRSVVQRRQIIFMDRDDILNLYVVTQLQVPGDAVRAAWRRECVAGGAAVRPRLSSG